MVATLTSDARDVATGLRSVVAALQVVQGIPAETLAHVRAYVAAMTGDAHALAGAAPDALVSMVRNFVNLIGSVSGALLNFLPSGSAVAVVIAAAQALIPIIMARVGLFTALAPGLAVTMMPDVARAHLRAGI